MFLEVGGVNIIIIIIFFFFLRYGTYYKNGAIENNRSTVSFPENTLIICSFMSIKTV